MQRRKLLLHWLQAVVERHVDISFQHASEQMSASEPLDGVHEYACETLSLGLLLMEFIDAIREGDGSRILRCWRYFLPIFRVANRTNYSCEAFTLLAQEKFFFSPRMASQLKWSRTVNMHGRPGKNVPCDLHMEHMNHECKASLSDLGSNITDHSAQRAG